jgi:hypothetical protein
LTFGFDRMLAHNFDQQQALGQQTCRLQWYDTRKEVRTLRNKQQAREPRFLTKNGVPLPFGYRRTTTGR